MTEGIHWASRAWPSRRSWHRACARRLDVELPRGEGVGYELLAIAPTRRPGEWTPEAALRAAARAYRDAIRATETA